MVILLAPAVAQGFVLASIPCCFLKLANYGIAAEAVVRSNPHHADAILGPIQGLIHACKHGKLCNACGKLGFIMRPRPASFMVDSELGSNQGREATEQLHQQVTAKAKRLHDVVIAWIGQRLESGVVVLLSADTRPSIVRGTSPRGISRGVPSRSALPYINYQVFANENISVPKY